MPGKKMLAAVLLIAFLSVSFSIPSYADTSGDIGVILNNKVTASNTRSQYQNGVLLFPAKELANALGGSFSYDSTLMSGTIKYGENELVFRLDSSVARFNGKYVQAPAPMKILDNRFMVPVRFVAEKLGAEVYMREARKTLMIFLPVNGKIIYQVISGDTLWIISQIFGTTVSSIKQLNSLSSDMIYVGQKLTIKNYTPHEVLIPAQISQNATLRNGAGFDSSIAGYLKVTTPVNIAGKSGDWYKVITPKGTGYVYYTTITVTQEITDTSPDSTYFSNELPVDTSGNYITYFKYTVKSGDYIWYLAEKFGIPDYELAAANNMTASSTLYVGQVLNIPVHNIGTKSIKGPQYGEVLDWFKEGRYVFPIGKEGKLIDLQTGKSFMIRRTMGASHSDTETLTAQDSQAMKEIFGGNWSWIRKAFILEADGRRYAVSVSGMPHAGVDGVPYLQNVENRSDNWGYGPNYDRIKGNGMNGHFDMYFLNGVRHVDSKIDPLHQLEILKAGGLE